MPNKLVRISSVSFHRKSGFTLAETLITVVILGVVAALTVPALINKQIEISNRTRARKAMATYEKIMNTMLIENDLKTNTALMDWADSGTKNNCQNTSNYFKIVAGSGCRFKTADRVWWDITNIENPIIILDEKHSGLDLAVLQNYAKSETDENGRKVYVYALVGRYEDTVGSIRVNDKAYEDVKNEGNYPLYMEKLYSFLAKRDMQILSEFFKGCTLSADGNSCTRNGITFTKKNISEDEEISLQKPDSGTRFCTYNKNQETGIREMICDNLTSDAEEGEIWVSGLLNLTSADAKSQANCDESRNKNYCKTNGDYWILAKRLCEEQGAHLATSAELKVLYNKKDGSLTNANYWADEATPSNDNYGRMFNTSGQVTYSTANTKNKAICIGRK